MTEVATESKLDSFLEAAEDLFDLHQEGRGDRNHQYIDVPVRIGEDRLPDDATSPDAVYGNPVIFITGIRTKKTTPTPEQPIAPAPSLSLVVGQYGLGKTELMFQVCHQMQYSVETPLPVNLALCRDRVEVLDGGTVTASEMADLLFGRIAARAGVETSFLLDQLQPAIRSGQIVLLLDGLDELISTPAQHHAFFAGLMTLLNHRGAEGAGARFKVVISMRFEYLSGVADDARDLVGRLRIPVFYLVLDYLGDSGVAAYLAARLPEMKSIFSEIRGHRLLLDMFRRPLLLRIFCDLALRSDFRLPELFVKLDQDNSPAALLDAFIDTAADDARLREAQDQIGRVIWSPGQLALKSLDLSRNGETELTVEHLRDVIVPIGDEISQDEIRDLPATEVLKGLHKCPFLRQDLVGVDLETDKEARVARFAHKIFLEYFTAKAMAAEMKAQSIVRQALDPTPQKRVFDELVLNVDMRKFLRGLLESDDEWRRETRKSYGLVDAKDLEEWKKRGTDDFDDLDRNRWTLLQFMTDPEHPPENIHKTVRAFLDRQQRWLHPRYLLYNYEAVAVYLWYERRNPATVPLKAEFGDIVRRRLEEVLIDLHGLGAAASDERRAKSLLLERLLDIGRRLNYGWVAAFADDRETYLMSAIDQDNVDVANRVRLILKDIRVTVF
jgi:hypothetical protein